MNSNKIETGQLSAICNKIHFTKVHLFAFYILIFKKTKNDLLYIRNQFVPRSKHFPTAVIKANQLMMYKAKVAIFSDIRTKHSTQSEGHVEFFNVKPCGT